ncbi:MAG TPA: SHOCT domain-containing protein [Myxococcota bacterium]|nr:SHOCT domain-containing protein [Myxococcota bacterium]
MPRHGLAALLLLALLAVACKTPVKEDVFKEGGVNVFLRSEKTWQFGSLIEKNYDHPITISPVRIAHILSNIDVRLAGKREPAIPTDMLFSIAEGISRALSRAGGEQEVVVMATEKERRIGIFDHDFLTSFVTYVKGPQLFVYLARIHWEVPAKQRDDPPLPQIGEERMAFRLYPSKGMELVEGQGVAADWRNEVFARPTRTKVLPSGKVVRKTILLESDEEEPSSAATDTNEQEPVVEAPRGLSPAQLRALADLEEARQAGEITEAEYVARQQEILTAEGANPLPPPQQPQQQPTQPSQP